MAEMKNQRLPKSMFLGRSSIILLRIRETENKKAPKFGTFYD
jgi:hypothetical protein